MNCSEAKKIDIVITLKNLGFNPSKETSNEAWFLSPFRKETKPSFKVNKLKNVYFDFGLGEGGNIIDLLCKLLGSVKEALFYLSSAKIPFSFHQQPIQLQKTESSISISEVKTIQHFGLIDYLDSRKISIHAARLICKEVHYLVDNKKRFSIGLKNVSGGWDLRNKYFPSGSSPKDISLIRNGNKTLIVTEGMFDMMSLLSKDYSTYKKNDLLVLNSCSFQSRLIKYIDNYDSVYLFLDNDETGKRVARELINSNKKYQDCSAIYAEYNDVNDWWITTN